MGDLGTRASDPPPPPEGRPPSRVIIEHIRPELDGGLFPVKRIVGDRLQVTADLLRDGHDKVAAAVHLRQFGESEWTVVPLRFVDNDQWGGGIPLTQVGKAGFVIEAWTDHFATWCDEVRKKRAAGQAVGLELAEGRALVEAAAKRAAGPVRSRLQACVARLDEPGREEGDHFALLLSTLLGLWMAQAADKGDATYSPLRVVTVDRAAARFPPGTRCSRAARAPIPRGRRPLPIVSVVFRPCASSDLT